MRRIWKWLLLALIIAEAVLVGTGILDIKAAIGVVVAIELLLFIVAGRQGIVAVRQFRRQKEAGLDAWAALEDGLEVFLPRRVAHIAALEPRRWFCLWRWAFRRVRIGASDFPYHGRSILGYFLILILFTTPVEIFLLELLIPWSWLRWLLLVAAVYTLFWIFGLYASLVALPHRLDSSSIRLFSGILAQAQIEYSNIAAVELNRLHWPSRGDGLHLAPDKGYAYLAVGGETDITLKLRKAQTLYGWLGPTPPVAAVHLAADEPQRLARELIERTGIEPVT
ncbi:MAG: hypothetical protein V1724_08200 [Chloroflexota bacterium]